MERTPPHVRQPTASAPPDGWLPARATAGLASVVVPVYNRAALALETFDSVLAQTYRPIELLVVDDGSTDGTFRQAQAWAERHGAERGLRVECLRQERSGAPAARNLGARRSRGEFIRWLDSDDLLAPRYITLCVRAMQRSGAPMAAGPGLRFRRTGSGNLALGLRNNLGMPRGLTPLQMVLRGVNVTLPNFATYRRSFVDRVGPWEARQAQFEDLEYALRAAAASDCLAYSAGAFALRRVHAARSILQRRGQDAMRSHARIVELAERLLREADLLDLYRREFACFVALRATRARRWEAPLTRRWLARLPSLGTPAPPLEYPLLRFGWKVLGVRWTRPPWRIARIARQIAGASRRPERVPAELLPH